MSQGAAPDYLVVGRIGRPHGVQGELQVDPLTDFPERFAPGATLFAGPERGDAPSPVRILSVRSHRDRLIIGFDTADDRDSAQLMTGLHLFIPIGDAGQLDEDTWYEHQLVGLEVITDTGRILGRVSSLMETGAADVLIVRGQGTELLLPMIGDVIADIDPVAGRITVTPLPGLIEDEEA